MDMVVVFHIFFKIDVESLAVLERSILEIGLKLVHLLLVLLLLKDGLIVLHGHSPEGSSFLSSH